MYNFGSITPMYNPYSGMQQSNSELIRVTGLEGAKAYQMSANSNVALFDCSEDLFYIKSTDGAGFPTIRTFKFEEITNFSKNSENINQFVTRKDMEDYVKQFIQQSANTPNESPNAITGADADDE